MCGEETKMWIHWRRVAYLCGGEKQEGKKKKEGRDDFRK